MLAVMGVLAAIVCMFVSKDLIERVNETFITDEVNEEGKKAQMMSYDGLKSKVLEFVERPFNGSELVEEYKEEDEGEEIDEEA